MSAFSAIAVYTHYERVFKKLWPFGATGWEEEGNKGPSVGHKYPGIVHVFLAQLQAPAKMIRANLINEGARGVKNRALNRLRKYSDEVQTQGFRRAP